MALIEGVGDEVTVLFGLLSALLVLALAWFSTRTAERGEPASASPPPLAPAQAGGEQPPEGSPSGQGAGAPASPSRDLRHRASLGSPEQPASPPGGPGAENPPADDTIVLRLKFLNDTERLARVRPQDTVGSLKRAHFPGQESLVRLIYQGQWLRDDSQTLRALHLAHHSVLHCHLLPRGPGASNGEASSSAAASSSSSSSSSSSPAALDVGGLLVPLLALLLGALWYLQLQYRHVFSATATACLAGLTLLVSLVAFAAYRR